MLQPGLGFKPAPGVRIYEHRRRLRAYLWQKSGGLCALCLKPIEPADVHADHIVPQSKGGTDTVDNLQSAHYVCNSRKNDRSNDEAIALIRYGVPYRKSQYVSKPATPTLIEPTTVTKVAMPVYAWPMSLSQFAGWCQVPISYVQRWISTGELISADVDGELVIEHAQFVEWWNLLPTRQPHKHNR